MKQYVNEYDEALNALTSGMLDTSDIEPYMDTIVKALKKQIPEKPHWRMFQKYKNWCCPVCSDKVVERLTRQNPYCKECGQSIDWNFGDDYIRKMLGLKEE